MIRPRPTTYYQGVREHDFTHYRPFTPHPIANCSICGARLRRYGRLPGETRCDPCVERHTRSLTPAELHPTPAGDGMNMCDCGGLKHRDAMMCRTCRYNLGGTPAA